MIWAARMAPAPSTHVTARVAARAEVPLAWAMASCVATSLCGSCSQVSVQAESAAASEVAMAVHWVEGTGGGYSQAR